MKIGIIGLGLIGGSIAIAAKRRLSAEVVALSRSEKPLIQAEADGIVDRYSTEDLTIFKGCDFVFVCTPVDKIVEYCKKLRTYIDENTIVTDVGSTKEKICTDMNGFEGINFIGGHPMAGTEYSGYAAAKENMFDGAMYVIVPLSETKMGDIEKFENFVRSIGAKPVVANAVKHDETVAAVSHVPHIIAYALSKTAYDSEDEEMLIRTLAAGGFRDTTRIAASNPEVWTAICKENRKNVLEIGTLFIREMSEALEYLENEDYEKLTEFFACAKEFRDRFKFS